MNPTAGRGAFSGKEKVMEKKVETKVGFGFLDALAILFIALKLLGIITWSWVWVLAPLWIQLILLIIGLIAIALAFNAHNRFWH